MNRVAICLICDEGYILPTVVAITSITVNKLDETVLDIFVVTTGISDTNRAIFAAFESESIHITVLEEELGELQTLHTTVGGSICVATPAALLKFRLPEILREYDKVLYLDGDIIVREDLCSLYDQDISEYFLAAVVDSGSIYYHHPYTKVVSDYFNSGVMLLNLKRMRESDSLDQLISTKRELNDSTLMDQNVFNIVFDGTVKLLPIRYNLLYVNLSRASSKFTISQINDRYGTNYDSLPDVAKDAAIIHFSSKDKPWKLANIPLASEWYEYFLLAKQLCPMILPSERITASVDSRTSVQSPLVSVIIPAYNVDRYITSSLRSITGQSLTDIQIVCVNDGSDDATLEMLDYFAKTDPRISIISQQNQGQSAARNVGLSTARGEYVYFFDSDDLLEANALELLYQHAKQTNSQNVLFDGVSFFENEDLAKNHYQYNHLYERSRDYPDIYRGDKLYSEMVSNGDYKVSPCLQFFQRSYLLDNGISFRKGVIHEDNLFSLKALLLCERVTHIRQNLFHRRIRENSTMTQSVDFKNFSGNFVCFVEMLEFVMTHQNALSDSAIIAAKHQLVHYYKTIGNQYWALPAGSRKRPQFLPPNLNLLSEVLYMPIANSSEAMSTSITLQDGKRVSRNQAKLLYEKLSSIERESQALRKESLALRTELKRSGSLGETQPAMLLPRKLRGLKNHLKSRGLVGTAKYTAKLILRRPH